MPSLQKKSELNRTLQQRVRRIFILLAALVSVAGIIVLTTPTSLTAAEVLQSPVLWMIISLLVALLTAYIYLKSEVSKQHQQHIFEPLANLEKRLREQQDKVQDAEKLGASSQSVFTELESEIDSLLADVSQQQRHQNEAEEKFANLYHALQESDSYFRSIFQQTNEGIILLKENGGHFYEFNQSAMDILGYRRRELSSLSLTDIIQDCRDEDGSLILTDKTLPERFSATFITYKGEHLQCQVSATDIEVEDMKHRMIMFHDITQKRVSERTLKALNSQLQAVLDASRHIAIIMVDSEGIIQLFNRGAESILKYSRAKVIDKMSITDIVNQCHTNDNKAYNQTPQFHDFISHFIENKIVLSQCKYRAIDGQLIPVEQTFTQIYDDQGKEHGYLFIAWDLRQKLTEEKRQQELVSQLQQSQKMETIGTLAGGIAHDLNNLLTPILGYTELLLEDSRDNPTHQKRLDRILSASLRAKELVKQILTFSHHIDHDAQPTLVKDIVKEVLELLFASLPANIKLNVDILDPEAQVFADLTKIHQVLMNLCTNAAHAIGKKEGQITIIIDSKELDEQTSNIVLPSGKYVKLSVKDTGSGISKAALNRIFEPFFTTKEIGEGTGLGLSVVHGIIRAHDGIIRVKSKLKKGTKFDIYLPYYGLGSENNSAKPDILVDDNKSIMLVDDEQPVLHLSQEILKRRGYQVEAFDNSRRALQAFKLAPNHFDVIITDQSMPDMTGTELAAEIHSINSKIPIILLTGLGQILSAKEQSDYGVSQVISKPVLSNDLVSIIYDVCNNQSTE